MTLLTLGDNTITSDEERTLLLGLIYDAETPKPLESEPELSVERDRYDDQILAGLVSPW